MGACYNHRSMEDTTNGKRKKSRKRGYVISLSLVFLLTAIALLVNFHTAGTAVNPELPVFEAIEVGATTIYDAIAQCEMLWLAVIAAVMVISYLIDALVLMVFARRT